MQWALVNNIRTLALPKSKAICPSCNEEVISKCGNIKIWHWAHIADRDCDDWSEGETEWHLNWKKNWKDDEQEVIIRSDGNTLDHRADIKNKNGVVIELQNSPISMFDILERETFYNNMIWLFNGETFGKGFSWRQKKQQIDCELNDKDGHIVYDYHGNVDGWKKYTGKIIHTFRWKHPPKTLWYVTKKMYIDLNNGFIFEVKKIYQNIPCGGWGKLISKEEFLKQYG